MVTLMPEDPVPIDPKTTSIERMDIKYMSSGRVEREGEGLVLRADSFDLSPLNASSEFLDQRRLKEGDYYVVVEYKNLNDQRIYIDVWKARAV